MRLRNLAALVAAALLAALPAVAQENRGSIEGVVKDAQGGAVVGATVTAKMSSALETKGERVSGPGISVVTDAAGKYRFPRSAPGRYEVSATLSGFAPAKVQNIDLRLGNQLTIPLTLSPAGVTETVQVVAESPLIAITQSARSTSIRDDEIEKMPKGRDFVSLVTQASGANMEAKSGTNAIMIDGSSGGENRWIIDGAESTNMVHGTQGKTMVTDFVEEVQVKSSGYTAEYGGSTGGVINVLSKSGSNQWRGDALVYYQSDSLDSDPRPTLRLKPTNDREAEYVTYPKDPYDRVEPGFNLSGPIVRDKVWFFAGYIPQFRPLDRTVTFSSDGSAGTFPQDYRSNLLSTNVTAQLGPQFRIRGGVQPEQREVRGRAARSGRHRQRHRELRRQRRLPELVGVHDDRLHAEQQGVHEPARRVLEERLLHRGRLRRGPGDVLRLVGRDSRRAGRVAAAQRLRERADEHRQHREQPEALPAPVRHHLLLLGRRRAPAEARRPDRPHRPRRSLGRARQPASASAGTSRSPATRARHLRPLPGAQQRAVPEPGVHHPGRREHDELSGSSCRTPGRSAAA